ncbi:MAG: transporter [Chitinophagaceae bacterium]
MIRIAALFICILVSCFASAQQTGRMETDRPDQTECPFIVKKGYIQGEVGFNYESFDGLHNLVHPTILWKYGASKRFEFRLITEINSMETPPIIPRGNKYETGFVPVQIGGKIALWEEKGLLPMTSLIFHVGMPKWAGKSFRLNQWAPNFRFTMQHGLTDNIGLGYNLGAEWDGFSSTPTWIYTIAPGFNLGKNGYAYIEAYGGFRKGEAPQHGIDGGLAYYVSDHVKLDISGGFNIINCPNYVAVGCSFRFRTGKK